MLRPIEIMSDAAMEEVSVLSSIYCRDGEFQIVQQSAQDGLVVQLNCTGGKDGKLNVSVMFHLDPSYPSSTPLISISSTGLSKSHCHNIRQKLMSRAAELPPEPMLHQLVEYLQECMEPTDDQLADEEKTGEERGKQQKWTSILMLDHIRSQKRYIGLLECWSQQLQLAGRLLLGQIILIILLGERPKIKPPPSATFTPETHHLHHTQDKNPVDLTTHHWIICCIHPGSLTLLIFSQLGSRPILPSRTLPLRLTIHFPVGCSPSGALLLWVSSQSFPGRLGVLSPFKDS
ncbi:RWD domain-containing protein 3 isoform X2 [Fundulus heteroclitus]|uniref:RWD domain-containing protein 3 isoform X2 n=1 Tax=Fundulus heteroclitus TaxID=8078 RepID=UPI00165A8C1C|nr:RWD domain-containing protein 3 isoform X2 [Fundulus heteroclitus]